jgi:hypothetical protein
MHIFNWLQLNLTVLIFVNYILCKFFTDTNKCIFYHIAQVSFLHVIFSSPFQMRLDLMQSLVRSFP